MTLRVIPPAYSPLRFSSVLAAAAGAIRGAGPAHHPLIRALRDWFPGARDILLTDSGTSALTLALGIGKRLHPGSPVAMPAYACYDLATAAIGADVEIRFYDVVSQTLEPDLESLRSALERGARTIVAVHLFGYPVDMPAIRALAAEFEALVIEDAAQALGAEIGGKPAGGWGDLTVLSFGRGKGVTGGHGGALVLNDPAFAADLGAAADTLAVAGRGVADVPLVLALWALTHPILYGLPARLPFLRLGETVYREPHRPSGLTAAAAAAARGSLGLCADEVGVRRRRATWLLERLLGHPRLATIRPPSDAVAPSFLRLPVVLHGLAANGVAAAARHLGVARGYPIALPDLPPLADRFSEGQDGMPGARRLAHDLITIPLHNRLTTGDLDALAAWVGTL